VETIIAEIAEKFIKNICEKLSWGQKFIEIEGELLKSVKECAAELAKAHIELVDAHILADSAGRRVGGYAVERYGDVRRLQTQIGEVRFARTYYKKASGGYEYLADTALGIEARERVSEGLAIALSAAAKDMSYAKASRHIADNAVSRQTVMHRVRRSVAAPDSPQRRQVPELHIDADEAHITLCGGKKSEFPARRGQVPLISVYEGIEKQGKRHKCRNVFHISEYGKKPDELWEQVLSEIERRYDLTGTKIYLHGDGASWIQTGFEWIPNAVFVLDKYHKNKAIKAMTAGLESPDRKAFDSEIRAALADEDLRFFDEMAQSLCGQFPQRREKIAENAAYLRRFVAGISVCGRDPGANNGGCTEPHVSHVLSARLSSRPMAWSKRTLRQLAPVLAAGRIDFCGKSSPALLPPLLRNAVVSANKSFRKSGGNRKTAGLPHPDAIGKLPLTGKITGTQKILKFFR